MDFLSPVKTSRQAKHIKKYLQKIWIHGATNSMNTANNVQWTTYSLTMYRYCPVWKLSSGMWCHIMLEVQWSFWCNILFHPQGLTASHILDIWFRHMPEKAPWENQQGMEKSSLHLEAYIWTKLSTCNSCSLLGLLFSPEDWDSTFLRDTGEHLLGYQILHLRR
jgi:hypothetical protein